jgi:hypothetical protein
MNNQNSLTILIELCIALYIFCLHLLLVYFFVTRFMRAANFNHHAAYIICFGKIVDLNHWYILYMNEIIESYLNVAFSRTHYTICLSRY